MVTLNDTLKSVWQKWMYISEKIGNIVSKIVLSILYFTVFSLPGIASRLFSDRLRIKAKHSSYWADAASKVPKNLEECREQG